MMKSSKLMLLKTVWHIGNIARDTFVSKESFV